MKSGYRRLLLAFALLALARPCRAEEQPAEFFRGLNLNGPALTIDGHAWDGKDSPRYACNGNAFENQSVPLRPETDRARAQMLRSSRWGRDINVDLLDVPAAKYQVFLYVWEDNDSTKFQVLVNDRVVINEYDSRGAGIWKKLGPWTTRPVEGKIRLTARGGDANLSGIEVWRGTGRLPEGAELQFAGPPDAAQLAFFEKEIRPLLVERCYECHSAESKKLGGNLLLDSRAGIVKGGDTEPPIVPGDAEASLLMTAVRHADPTLKMPPTAKLSDAEIAALENWIAMRAPDPRTGDTVAAVARKSAIEWDEAREFWSLRPIQNPTAPKVSDAKWARNDVDRFILERLEREQLAPVADADRRTLIRRATYDLIGLPPTPEEIEAFVNDASPDAFAHVVERLLASPHYGERWGRHWLDVVRYADTAGDNSDFPIPQMHRYRDWVISAINRDLPYDRFVREQLAGDLLPAENEEQRREQIIATGYIANARRFGSRVSDYPQHLTIEDTLDNLGRTFLGLTINCARCHDHKFDPITNEDYYALYGIFHSTRYPWPGIELEQKQRDLVPLTLRAEAEAADQVRREKQTQLDAEVKRLEKERDAAQGDARAALEKQVQSARSAAENHARSPLPYELAYAVAEGTVIEDVRVQQKGDPAKPGRKVPRRFLTALGGTPLPADDRTSGRRQLAEWIVDRQNPLTARVMANRVWSDHFGRGLVPTPNDFGKQGKPPTHPELLDWLATKFVESGWSLKAMHRLIMLSHTYQLAGEPSAAAQEKDPTNALLSAFPRHRLDAESIRDTLLVLGGNLAPPPAGPHPFPPQHEWKFTQHNPFKAVYDTQSRSVYLMTQRIQRHPYLAIFDGPDPSVSTPLRSASTTPLQALYLMNDPFFHEQSQRFAARVLAERSDTPARIERSYLLALGRAPDSEELAASQQFLDNVRGKLQASGIPADQLEPQAWQAFVRALFRLNEFVYID